MSPMRWWEKTREPRKKGKEPHGRSVDSTFPPSKEQTSKMVRDTSIFIFRQNRGNRGRGRISKSMYLQSVIFWQSGKIYIWNSACPLKKNAMTLRIEPLPFLFQVFPKLQLHADKWFSNFVVITCKGGDAEERQRSSRSKISRRNKRKSNARGTKTKRKITGGGSAGEAGTPLSKNGKHLEENQPEKQEEKQPRKKKEGNTARGGSAREAGGRATQKK